MEIVKSCAFLTSLMLAVYPGNATPYTNDFDGNESLGTGITGGFSGAGSIESVQGYAALSQYFAGDFLRNSSDGNPAPASTLSLSGLSSNASYSLTFSLAIIDSWDGTLLPPTPVQSPDFFNVDANGSSVFSETFTNVSHLGATQSYTGGALAYEQNLGFEIGANRLDSAYLMQLTVQADQSGTLILDFYASGAGWLDPSVSSTEETWAIDSILLELDGTPGDFDGDGDIDGVDVATMFSNFNGPGGGVPSDPATDLDCDGDADGVDVATLFGLFTGPLTPTHVPEPSALAALAFGCLLTSRRKRDA